MNFNFLYEDRLTPDMPEKVNRAELESVDGSVYLKAEEYIMEGHSKIYFESPTLEGLLGYSPEEIIERIDETYDSDFGSLEVNSMDYGNGWAIIDLEE